MPCDLTVFDTQARTKTVYRCDEGTTSRLVEDDHAAKATGEYTNVAGNRFSIDWTTCRLIGFSRKRDDGSLIASGGADGSQTAVT
jgi:hypothetical protein